MLRDEPSLRPGLFQLPEDPVAEKILIPGFRAASSVRGAFGWFTVGWIEKLAPGLATFLNREVTETIDFIVAPEFFKNERDAVEMGARMSVEKAAELIGNLFIRGRAEASMLAKHTLDCLAWMIAMKRLRLRIAVPTPNSNYHPKIWLFDDGDNQVIARGSGNATGRGVADGVEHVDVDVSWFPGSQERVVKGVNMLNDWSKGRSEGIEEVVELPEAILRDIINTAPSEPPQHFDYEAAVAYHRDEVTKIPRKCLKNRLQIPSHLDWLHGQYAHQGDAVKAWEEAENPESGVISMATGAGKTITALICATRCQERVNDKPFLIVISAPSKPLIMQWTNEVKKFGISPIAPSLESNTDSALTHFFRKLSGGGTQVLIVTNNLLCNRNFQNTISRKLYRENHSICTMLIADEAHSLGAESFIRNKPEFFQKRLAISATPVRQYDPDGTEEIFDFFGPTVYEFGLELAIGFCLVPYSYFVHACTLDSDELEEFELLTRKIGGAIRTDSADDNSTLESLLILRRRIIETARGKIECLRKVILHRGMKNLRYALIYASAKNPEQFSEIENLLTSLKIKWAPVTQETTKNPQKLKRILESFERGTIHVLLAKKVLDEGVDIPAIREAFIVASSTVEREWVQRRGRVLRSHPGKQKAIVHDFLALPPAEMVSTKAVKRIVETELKRAHTFGGYSDNVTGESGVHADLKRITESYWSSTSVKSDILNRENQYKIASGVPRGRLW